MSKKKEALTIAVDSGKFLTKAVIMEQGEGVVADTFSIRTKIVETEQTNIKDDNRFILSYGDTNYLMGAEDSVFSFDRSKKLDEHRLSTFLAISQLAPNGASVNLAIGIPLSIYEKQDELLSYQKFMLDIDENEDVEFPVTINFTVNEVEYEYSIEVLATFAESSGYIMSNLEEHEEDEAVGIVDIGGLNVNAAIYRRTPDGNLSLVRGRSLLTTNNGINRLTSNIKAALESEFNTTIESTLMDDIMLRGYFGIRTNKPVVKKSSEIINKMKEDYFGYIKADLLANNWDFFNMVPVFVGGGSILLKNAIEKDEDLQYSIISENAQWDNVLGFASLLYDSYN